MTAKIYRGGTHRALPPAETLQRVAPLFPRFGVTRVADVTGLDDLTIPVFCAVRPRGILLQVSNGKGLCAIDAKVSAVMEALEVSHAESPPGDLVRASYRDIRKRGPALRADELPGFWGDQSLMDQLVLDWVSGEDLLSRAPVWMPASSAWLLEPTCYRWSSNGLASGNTLDEATLHALLEIYERHVFSKLMGSGLVCFDAVETLSLADAPGEALGELRARTDAAGVRVVLLRAASTGPVHCFMAVLLDPRAFASASTVNLGYGAHLSPEVAAVRAITEAAQSRLTFIHGAREDLTVRAYDGSGRRELYDFFANFEPDEDWSALTDHSRDTIELDLARVLEAMQTEDLCPLHRVVLSTHHSPIAVVKIVAKGARTDLLSMGHA